jgi:hypothetical protein
MTNGQGTTINIIGKIKDFETRLREGGSRKFSATLKELKAKGRAV